MSSKSTTWENALLLLVFNNTTFANVGDAGGLLKSVGDGNLYVSFHTADPGEGGTADTNETAYTGYARIAVPRTSAGWTITADSCSPNGDKTAPECTASPGAALTHFAVSTGTDGAGVEDILYYGALTPNITMAVGVSPILDSTTTITEA